MAVMWTAQSFLYYLLNFMNKYLEGTIYENNYAEAFSGLIAILVGSYIYSAIGKKYTFILAYTLGLLGGIVIFLLEAGIVRLPDSYIDGFKGPHKVREEKAVNAIVPRITFILKFGI